jgi:hypothetical protein
MTEFLSAGSHVQGGVVPPGVEVAQTRRATHDQRDRYITHLAACAADGRISADELDRRLTIAQTAVTEQELHMLLHDLPALPWPAPEPQPRWKRLGFGAGISCYTAGMAAAVITAWAGPQSVATVPGWSHHPLLVFAFVGTLVVGVLGVAADAIAFGFWMHRQAVGS